MNQATEPLPDNLQTEEQEIASWKLVCQIAAMTKDGEVDDDGNAFNATDQDCQDTLHRLIEEARDIYWAEEREVIL